MNAKRVTLKQQVIQKTLVIIVIISLLVSGSGYPVSAQNNSLQTAPNLSKLTGQCSNGQSEMAYQAQTGKIRFIGTAKGKPIRQPLLMQNLTSPSEAARGYLSVCGPLFGLKNQAAELHLKHQNRTVDGRSVVRFQQTYKGIPIFGAELVVQLDSANNVIMVNGDILPGILMNTVATVDMAAAQQTALQLVTAKYELGSDALTISQPVLSIYDPGLIQPENGATSLVWRMEVTPVELKPIRELVLVDAHSGKVVLDLNQVDTALNRMTYTAGNGTARPGSLVCDESNPNCTGGDLDAVNAHVYGGDTYDFYMSYFGRDSLDNAGMTLISTVHYASNYCNAFWDGNQMTYGDGCFIVADDIVAHEMTHGVTEHESGLIYAYESGAINESLSDIFGEFVDLTNGKGTDTPAVRWYIGEDTSTGATRYLKDPTVFGDPDRMGSPNYYLGSEDNGGVHWNSGVGNKAAYLITDGDTFNGYTITGIGITKTAKIYYEAQTNILTPSSNYASLYNGLYQACQNLIGTSGITPDDCTQVRTATLATEMNYVRPPHVCATNKLCVQVLNNSGNPFLRAFVEVYTNLNESPKTTGWADYLGWIAFDIDAGNYKLVVSSSSDHILITRDVIAPGLVTVNPSGTVQVNVNVRKLDGSPLQAAGITANPSTYSAGSLGCTDLDGSLTAWVSPGTYAFLAWADLYYLAISGVSIDGTSNIDMYAASMPTGQMPITLTDFEYGNVIPFSDQSHLLGPIFPVTNGDVVTLSAMNYNVMGELKKEQSGGAWWTYQLDGTPLTITSGGSTPYITGGPFTSSTSTVRDSYLAGEPVSTRIMIKDSYNHRIVASSMQTQSALFMQDKRLIMLDDTGLIKSFSPSGVDEQLYASVYPHSTVTDPNGTIISEAHDFTTYTGHYFSLPTDSVPGTYHVDLTLDTGPHNGVISANDTFLVESLTYLPLVNR